MTAVPLTSPASEAGTPSIEARSSGKPLGWWGMVTLITTEAMIFALLFFVYFYLRANSPHWPQGDIKDPELKISSIRTVILLASSIPMSIADRAIRKGERGRMMVAMAVAWVMGAVFLVGHVQEYVTLWDEFTPGTNAYGSIYYTLTGLHALHLIAGMTIIAFILVRAFRGHYDEHDHLPVQTSIMYWHFVDVVWVAVFSSLYLSVSLL